MLINEMLNKDQNIVPDEAPLIILDIHSSVCMARKVKYVKHTRHIARRVLILRNDVYCKMNNIEWCEGGLQVADISTKNVGESDLNLRMKYIMVSLDN